MSKDHHDIPIRCTGIAVILLKKIENHYKVLLLKRATSILLDAWCYIGGGIEEGEKAWEAARREIEEETGIKGVTLYTSNQFDQFYSAMEDYIYIAPVFVGYVEEQEDVKLNYEHKEYKWMTFNEAKEKVILPGNAEVLDFVEKYFVNNHPTEWLRVGR
jgi:dATP pyrophosphohydrolase